MFCFEVSDSLGLPCQTTHNLFPLGVATADHLPQSNPNTLFCLTNPLHVLPFSYLYTMNKQVMLNFW